MGWLKHPLTSAIVGGIVCGYFSAGFHWDKLTNLKPHTISVIKHVGLIAAILLGTYVVGYVILKIARRIRDHIRQPVVQYPTYAGFVWRAEPNMYADSGYFLEGPLCPEDRTALMSSQELDPSLSYLGQFMTDDSLVVVCPRCAKQFRVDMGLSTLRKLAHRAILSALRID